MNSENEQLAYLAGFFDGEGCIHISATKPERGTKGWSPRYTLTVSASNTRPIALELLRTRFGGCYKQHNNHRFIGRKPCWSWSCSSRQAEKALKAMLPYMKIKRVEAELALEYMAVLQVSKTKRRVSKEELEKREGYRLNLMQLKR
jgi:hypothetical protein